jgi:hypothetical protein
MSSLMDYLRGMQPVSLSNKWTYSNKNRYEYCTFKPCVERHDMADKYDSSISTANRLRPGFDSRQGNNFILATAVSSLIWRDSIARS